MKISSLQIPARAKTPLVSFNLEMGKFEISGRSIMENSSDFYQPILLWMREYCAYQHEYTELVIKLEYINSGTRRILMLIFKELTKLDCLKIYWYYPEDDHDIYEIGQDYELEYNLDFTYFKIPSSEFNL
jgi:hypothetical protein